VTDLDLAGFSHGIKIFSLLLLIKVAWLEQKPGGRCWDATAGVQGEPSLHLPSTTDVHSCRRQRGLPTASFTYSCLFHHESAWSQAGLSGL
jgi:hypothetical protein